MKRLVLSIIAALACAGAAYSQSKAVFLYDGSAPKYGLSYDLAPIDKGQNWWLSAVAATSMNGNERIWGGAGVSWRVKTSGGISLDLMAGLTANIFEEQPKDAKALWYVGVALRY